MALETDLLIDRRRLKRSLVGWRVAAVALAALAVSAVLPWPHGGGRHIARVSVAGIITDDEAAVRRLRGLAEDRSVAAVLLRVDSPGGSVAGGEALHDAVAHVAAAKPVVVSMGGTAASAAYMLSAPATRIFARNSTLTGSIGVILETAEVGGLLSKLGITATALVSGPLKGQPSFTEPMSPEGRQVLQGIVADLYGQFVQIVASGRHMDPARVRALADGRAYTGQQALPLGLVDEIGGEEAALEWLHRAKGVPSLPVRDLRPQRGVLVRAMGAVFGSAANSLMLQGVALDGALALWQPGLTR